MKTRFVSLAVLAATVGLLALAPPAAEAEVRVGPNYRLNSDSSPYRGQDQVGLAVNPGNPQHVVAVYANYLDSSCDASASFDGGGTWSAAFRLAPPGPAGGRQVFRKGCNNSVGTSQYVAFGTGQTVYTATTGQWEGPGFLQDATALLHKSTDGGLTWTPGVVAMSGGPGSLDFTSGPAWYRPAIAVHRGGGTGGADRVYLIGRVIQGNGKPCGNACPPVRSAVSNDGGQTFSNPVEVTPDATNAQDFPSQPVVNSDGSVTVAWRVNGIEGLIQIARSTNGGQSWGAPVDVTRVSNSGTLVTTHVPTNPPTGQSASASYPRMAGGPTAGSLYMVYSQGSSGPTAPAGGYQGADHFISPDSQVWFQRSSNNGATWSTPRRISEQTSFPGSRTHQTRHPTISVSPGGRINVVWHDRRHWYHGAGQLNCSHSHTFCQDIRLGDTYYSYSTDGGTSFSRPLRVNDRSLNNEVGYDTRPSGYWWFGPVSVTVGGDKVLIGWMDSREGNWDTDTEDIYLATVDFNASGAAPRTHVDASSAVARSVALSQVGYPAGNEGALIGGLYDAVNRLPDPLCSPGPPVVTTNCPTGPASRNASAVVIANEGDVAGALAGSVLARANPGPVLLSPASGLPATVAAEVARISPARAFVVGDAGKLSEQVVSDLAGAGVPAGQITRLAGANDAATAAAIAARMDYRTHPGMTPAERVAPAFDAAVIANPASPDAAAAAGLAAARRLPVLYVGSATVPPETMAALTSLNIDKTLVVGGSSSVAATVLGLLPGATRLGGNDQYETSRAVVNESLARGLPSNVVYFADGSKPMDAALLGAVVARATGVMALAPAPLHATAVRQAEDFGLSGIARFILLGPAAPAAAPGPPAAPPPPQQAAADTTAPVATLSGGTRQKLGRTVSVSVACPSEACKAVVGGTIKVPKVGKAKAKTFKLKAATANIAQGATRKVSLTLSAKARAAIKRALKARRSVSARLAITVTDGAGNVRKLTRTVRFVR